MHRYFPESYVCWPTKGLIATTKTDINNSVFGRPRMKSVSAEETLTAGNCQLRPAARQNREASRLRWITQ
jgi:hypothetical protein